jgi:hypothetical protein
VSAGAVWRPLVAIDVHVHVRVRVRERVIQEEPS